MKIKDLIKELSKFDGDLTVLCYTENEELLPAGYGARLLEIDDINVHNAEISRREDGIVSPKFERSELSKEYVLISVNSDL